MRTPFDDDMGKFTWFLFRVYPRPFLLTLSLPFLPSNISLFSRVGWLVGWLGRLGYPQYVYRAYIFVNDSNDEQATTLYKFVMQNIARLASECVIWVTNR